MSIIGKTFLNIEDSHLRVVSGNVYAQAINISGINLDAAHGLQSVTNTGNQTFNTLQFSNAITGFVTTANAQIGRDLVVSGNTTVSTDLTVSANATVAKTLTISEHLIASKEATVTGNLHVTTIRSDSNVVTEYTGPHDRPLRKYPEVALTSASQGGYIVTQSNQDTVNSYFAYEAFNEITNTTDDIWYTGNLSHYNTSDGSATETAPQLDSGSNTDRGEWIALELPKFIKLDSFKLWRQDNWEHHHPVSATLYAKKTSSDSWTEIYRYDDINSPTTGTTNPVTPGHFNVNSQVFYRFFAFVVRKRSGGASNGPTQGIGIAELEYYGYEEGSGSLDTTLKTVYNVPATTGTQLEVYYDGQDYTDMPTVGSASVIDKAGGDQTGTPGTSVSFDSTYKAFVFDGSANGKITGTHGLGTGTGITPTISLWFKLNSTGDQRLCIIGDQNTQYKSINVTHFNGRIALDYWLSEVQTPLNSVIAGQWYHLAIVHKGPGTTATGSQDIYINNVKQALNLHTTHNSNSTFDLQGTGLTIGADPAGTNPLTGSIANFRLFSKALNAGQVKELYDYQKDYFLGSKSQVTLYKGHLGVGVTEPSGQLELAGDERIQEYPPRALTGYETLVEGHGVFCASWSSNAVDASNDTWYGWRAFDGDPTTNVNLWHSNGGYSQSGTYTTTSIHSLGGYQGEWVRLDIPYEIKLTSFRIRQRSGSNAQAPKSFLIIGSNTGNEWDLVFTIGDAALVNNVSKDFTVNSTKYYKYYALVVTSLAGTGGSAAISELRYFGTPGPTTLDKGSLTLGRSLDVPRISRYDVDTETPRYEKLVVDFDTTVNSSPTDISGKGNHGEFKNNASYSAPDKAFKFAAANAHIYLNQNTLSGTSATHTFSLWINALSGPGNGSYEAIFEGGVRSNNQAFGLYAYQDGSNTRVYYHVFGSNLPSNTAGYIVNTNSWYHICGTLDNSGNVRRFYVNGELFASDTYGSLNVTHPRIRIGENVDGSESWHGMVSNFKLYSVALEPSEVKKLYNLGRTGRSMVISDTAVGIGKVPEAQLDVRGNIKTSGMVNNAGMRWYISGAGGNAEYTVGENWFSRNGAVVDGVPTVYGTVQRVRNGAEASVWNETTGFFTAPEDGIYSIDLVMFINGFSGSRWGGFQLQNSAGGTEETTYTFYTANISIEDTMSYSKTVYMEKGWKFRFYTPEGTVTLYVSGMHSSLNIHKIS